MHDPSVPSIPVKEGKSAQGRALAVVLMLIGAIFAVVAVMMTDDACCCPAMDPVEGHDTHMTHHDGASSHDGPSSCCGASDHGLQCGCTVIPHSSSPASHVAPQWEMPALVADAAVPAGLHVAFEGEGVPHAEPFPLYGALSPRPPPVPIYIRHCQYLM